MCSFWSLEKWTHFFKGGGILGYGARQGKEGDDIDWFVNRWTELQWWFSWKERMQEESFVETDWNVGASVTNDATNNYSIRNGILFPTKWDVSSPILGFVAWIPSHPPTPNKNRGYGSVGNFITDSFQYTYAIQGPLLQEITGQHDGVHIAVANNAWFRKMYCDWCHLSLGRKDLVKTVPATKLPGHAKGCDRKIFHIWATI